MSSELQATDNVQSKLMARKFPPQTLHKQEDNAEPRNLTIQSSKRMVEEAWFKTAIEDAPDYLCVFSSFPPPSSHIDDPSVVAGHMPVRGETSEFTPIFDTIRKRHPDIPVFIFGTLNLSRKSVRADLQGGHTHVRDCVQYDDRSIA